MKFGVWDRLIFVFTGKIMPPARKFDFRHPGGSSGFNENEITGKKDDFISMSEKLWKVQSDESKLTTYQRLLLFSP